MNTATEVNERVIGKCSLCGGPVTVPIVWHGINMPLPACKHCGATHHAEDSLPTLPMRQSGIAYQPVKPNPAFDDPAVRRELLAERWKAGAR